MEFCMRIRIELGLKDKSILVRYKSQLQGMIYHMIRQDDSASILHDEGYRVENRPFKLFVFSDLIGQFTYDTKIKMMHFETNAYFEVASIQVDFMIEMVKYLQNHNSVHFGKQIIDVIDVQIIEDPKIIDKASFITISPITVYKTNEEKTIYLSPNEDEFIHMIHHNILKKCEAFQIDPPTHLPHINIISSEKRIIYFRDHFLIAYHLKFDMHQLRQPYLTIMLNTGLGSKNSMGFGMIRYAN